MSKPQRAVRHSGIVPFDPLQYVKRLEAVGFNREQAEAQAETFSSIVQEQLITKQDLQESEAKTAQHIKELDFKFTLECEAIRRDIKELESKTILEIEILRRDLKIWFGGMLVTLIVALSSIQALIAHFVSH